MTDADVAPGRTRTVKSAAERPMTTLVSERQVRLLYRTTCWVCGDPVPAGTTTWWDDDRRHATCTGCFVDAEQGAPAGPRVLTPRAARRARLLRVSARG